jgi:penicillin-binding protein 1A
VGTHRIARLAHQMGITTPLSTNPAMTIGGLTTGVTPLDMAHAYETIAHGGRRVSGTLAEPGAPVSIQEVSAGTHTLPNGGHRDVNRVETRPVLPTSVAATETSILETVLQYGTARAAATGQFAAGKTGTTSNYGDAWFIGWDSKYTVAVWVGFPNKLVPMTNAFNGGPVLGGTFPALIWHDFITSAMHIDQARAERSKTPAGEPPSGSSTPGAEPPSGPSSPAGPPATATGAPPAKGNSSPPSGGGHEAGAPPAGSGGEHSAPPAPAPSPPPPASPPASSPPPASSSPPPTGGVSPGGSAPGG